jgi:hypothetical protein
MTKSRLITAFCLAAGLAVSLPGVAARAQDDASPGKLIEDLMVQLPAAELANLRAAVELQRAGLAAGRAPDEPAAFDEMLSNLARDESALGSETARRLAGFEGRSIEAKLIAIARDRMLRPDTYQELVSIYVDVPKDTGSIAPGAPRLRSEHMTEDYRLAWEYFLLRPPAETDPDRFPERVVAALAAIGNPVSLPAIEAAVAAATQADVPLEPRLALRQRGLVAALSAFPTDEGVDVLGRVVGMLQAAQERGGAAVSEPLRGTVLFDPTSVFVRDLNAVPGQQVLWQAAIARALETPAQQAPAVAGVLLSVQDKLRLAIERDEGDK